MFCLKVPPPLLQSPLGRGRENGECGRGWQGGEEVVRGDLQEGLLRQQRRGQGAVQQRRRRWCDSKEGKVRYDVIHISLLYLLIKWYHLNLTFHIVFLKCVVVCFKFYAQRRCVGFCCLESIHNSHKRAPRLYSWWREEYMGDEMGLSARLAGGPGSALLLFGLSVMYCLVELHR